MAEAYIQKKDNENVCRIKKIVDTMPSFCNDFFRAIESSKSSTTRLGYAYDISLFFYYLNTRTKILEEYSELDVKMLDKVTNKDIEDFVSFLTMYEKDGKTYNNSNAAKARKLASIRAFFNYYFKNKYIETNATAYIETPKDKEKNILRLEQKEIVKMYKAIETGNTLSKKQQETYDKTKVRDNAIITLLLGTGMRVSECVGIDIDDVNFEDNNIRIIRKGGDEDLIYFNHEIKDALQLYMQERHRMIHIDDNALFLSLKNQRLSVRSVERLVKKYAKGATVKKITPHKLRSTYGSDIYRETGDIYLVATLLGHKDVNTTKAHYADKNTPKKIAISRNYKIKRED